MCFPMNWNARCDIWKRLESWKKLSLNLQGKKIEQCYKLKDLNYIWSIMWSVCRTNGYINTYIQSQYTHPTSDAQYIIMS